MNFYKLYKRRSLFLFLLFSTYTATSQNLFTSFFIGSSNYSGDLQEKRFTFNQAHPAAGVGLLYEINEKMLLRGDFTFGKISGDDKYSAKNKSRNLNFVSNIYEYSIGFEYSLLDLYLYKVSPYLFTGVSLFSFNPYAKQDNGNLILLAELSTEGEGFYNGRKEYKLRQVSIPFGGGFQWAINDNKRIGIVVGFRKTFTDYLDDVSTTYIDQSLLVTQRGQKAANIAYRGDELPNGAPYPADGTIRGNPKSKDWYYFTGLTFRVRINPHRREIRGRLDINSSKRSRTDCPKIF